jgi:hypothetical protein
VERERSLERFRSLLRSGWRLQLAPPHDSTIMPSPPSRPRPPSPPRRRPPPPPRRRPPRPRPRRPSARRPRTSGLPAPPRTRSTASLPGSRNTSASFCGATCGCPPPAPEPPKDKVSSCATTYKKYCNSAWFSKYKCKYCAVTCGCASNTSPASLTESESDEDEVQMSQMMESEEFMADPRSLQPASL